MSGSRTDFHTSVGAKPLKASRTWLLVASRASEQSPIASASIMAKCSASHSDLGMPGLS